MMTIEELNGLPDEKLRVMCAEIFGWKRLPKVNDRSVCIWPDVSTTTTENSGFMLVPDGSSKVGQHPPNYPADLNAMHEAEKTLTDDEARDYNLALMDAKPPRRDIKTHSERWTWGSTARQRCIAFIAVQQTDGREG